MQIEVNLKTVLVTAGVMLVAATILVLYFTGVRKSYEGRIIDLQNQVAARDKTIEVKEGVYQKLALQTRDLQMYLGSQTAELAGLRDTLERQKASILAANTIIAKLRKDLDAKQTVVVVTDPNKPGVKGVNIDTGNQMDPFQVLGKVMVDCDSDKATVELHLKQCTPVSFSVVVSQDKDGTWRTSATSSHPNFEVDISLAAVNPYMLESRWYEKIGLGVDLGVGTAPGFLGGIGVYYGFGKFEVGPRAWFVADPHGVYPYFGAQLLWHPFAK